MIRFELFSNKIYSIFDGTDFRLIFRDKYLLETKDSQETAAVLLLMWLSSIILCSVRLSNVEGGTVVLWLCAIKFNKSLGCDWSVNNSIISSFVVAVCAQCPRVLNHEFNGDVSGKTIRQRWGKSNQKISSERVSIVLSERSPSLKMSQKVN